MSILSIVISCFFNDGEWRDMRHWLPTIILAGGVLSGCSSYVAKVSGSASSQPPEVKQASELETDRLVKSSLAEHAQNTVRFWNKGDYGAAKNEWQAMLWLKPEARPFSVYFIPYLDVQQQQAMVSILEGDEIDTAAEDQTRINIFPVETNANTNIVSESIAPSQSKLTSPVVSEQEKDWLRTEIKKILLDFGEREDVELPQYFVDEVARFIKIFSSPDRLRGWYGRALARMDKYHPLIHGVFSEKKMPESLYYLALVESGFNPNAVSSAKAVGLWQFMPATARQYGLKVSRHKDQRRNPRLSTKAAREYLLNLILDFGDGHSMLLAMAAYNAGENGIRRRLRKLDDYRDRNFWALSKKKLLPKETRLYIPKILAAAIIGENRARFGFDESAPQNNNGILVLHRSVSLPYVQKMTGISKAKLITLNPDLDGRSSTPAGGDGFELVLPKSLIKKAKSDRLITKAMVAQDSKSRSGSSKHVSSKATTKLPSSSNQFLAYKVKAGNTLSGISTWSGVSISKIQRDNPSVTRNGLQAGKTVYLKNVNPNLKLYRHKVLKGESLSKIAELYQVPQSWLQGWNGSKSLRPKIGQVLLVYVSKEAQELALSNAKKAKKSTVQHVVKTNKQSSKKTKTAKKPTFIRYTVQPRNTYSSIAAAFDISVRKLKSVNKGSSRNLQVGRKLSIPVSGWTRASHKVRPGETLAIIAKKHAVNTRKLMTFNGMRNSRIYVGDELFIYKKSSS